MRSNEMTSTMEKSIRKLGKLQEKKVELVNELKILDKKCGVAEEKISSNLEQGVYVVGNFVCTVKDKLTGGRETTSWKAVALGTSDSAESIAEKLTKKNPECAPIINKFKNRVKKTFQELFLSNTKKGEDKLRTLVTIARSK